MTRGQGGAGEKGAWNSTLCGELVGGHRQGFLGGLGGQTKTKGKSAVGGGVGRGGVLHWGEGGKEGPARSPLGKGRGDPV